MPKQWIKTNNTEKNPAVKHLSEMFPSIIHLAFQRKRLEKMKEIFIVSTTEIFRI